jgi:hypothetical protein
MALWKRARNLGWRGFVLRHVLKCQGKKHGLLLHLWIPVIIAGVVVALLPLREASGLGAFPFAIVVLFLPSMALIGLGQWLLLRHLIGGSFNWVLMTMVGAASGNLSGLVITLAPQPIPGDFIWIFMTGAGIGLFQGATSQSLRLTRSSSPRIRRILAEKPTGPPRFSKVKGCGRSSRLQPRAAVTRREEHHRYATVPLGPQLIQVTTARRARAISSVWHAVGGCAV